ncbi:MAG TPA: CocE/NonD family hydrolase [Pseudonocardia sp.]|nr:CocE/NonD family hydrolase [Pseudonocardia sp.]
MIAGGWGRVAVVAVGAVLVTSACAGPATPPGSAPPGSTPPSSAPAGSAPAWPPTGGRGPCAVTKTADVPVPMRDGTVLGADVYRPTTDQPVPVILYRTQYNKTAAQVTPFRYQTPDWFASHCYLVVNQTVLHDPAHPSALLLPIVPVGAEPPTLPAAPTH